jgi:hypothetical protein
LSDFDFSSEDSSSSEDDEKVNYKKKEDDFTWLSIMTKARFSRNNFDSDSDVMDGGLENKWLMDSGCSRHMTGDKKWFSRLTSLSH